MDQKDSAAASTPAVAAAAEVALRGVLPAEVLRRGVRALSCDGCAQPPPPAALLPRGVRLADTEPRGVSLRVERNVSLRLARGVVHGVVRGVPRGVARIVTVGASQGVRSA